MQQWPPTAVAGDYLVTRARVPGNAPWSLVTQSVGHGEGLHDAADALARAGLELEPKVVAEQTVGKQVEGKALLVLFQGLEKGLEIHGRGENRRTVIAPMEDGVAQAVCDQAW